MRAGVAAFNTIFIFIEKLFVYSRLLGEAFQTDRAQKEDLRSQRRVCALALFIRFFMYGKLSLEIEYVPIGIISGLLDKSFNIQESCKVVVTEVL